MRRPSANPPRRARQPQVSRAIGWVWDKLKGLAHWVTDHEGLLVNLIPGVGPLIGGGNWLAGHLGLPHFASGGTMTRGGLALVGERGPEVLSLPGGARIEPLASGGLAGAITVIVKPQPVKLHLDRRQVGEAVAQYEQDVAARR